MVTAGETTVALRTLSHAYSAVLDAVDRDLLKEAELPLTWFEVLYTLSENQGALRMQDLAEQIGLSRSGVTRLVHRLENAELVARDDCTEDRRGCFAALTELGSEKLSQAVPHFTRSVEENFLSSLGASEAKLLLAALTKVLEAHRCGASRIPSRDRQESRRAQNSHTA